MATQSGTGICTILIIAGAGYIGTTILIQNGKLSKWIGDIQLLVLKQLEKPMDQAKEGEGKYPKTKTNASLVHRLANGILHLAAPFTALNGASRKSKLLLSSLVWWKGFSFSDLMFVSKRNMKKTTADLTKLQRASNVRFQNLDDKLLKQNGFTQSIKDEVLISVIKIHDDVSLLQQTIKLLEERLDMLSLKQQGLQNALVLHLGRS